MSNEKFTEVCLNDLLDSAFVIENTLDKDKTIRTQEEKLKLIETCKDGINIHKNEISNLKENILDIEEEIFNEKLECVKKCNFIGNFIKYSTDKFEEIYMFVKTVGSRRNFNTHDNYLRHRNSVKNGCFIEGQGFYIQKNGYGKTEFFEWFNNYRITLDFDDDQLFKKMKCIKFITKEEFIKKLESTFEKFKLYTGSDKIKAQRTYDDIIFNEPEKKSDEIIIY